MPFRLELGRDNEQNLYLWSAYLCHATLYFADLDRSLPQMPFPGRRVLADSCLGTLFSLWVSLLLFSESFSILQYPVWEGERREQTVNVAVWWQVALASSLPPHCLGVTLSDACLWTEPWEHPWCLLCCENEFLVPISASITLAYANVRALVWNAVIVFLIHVIPLQKLCSLFSGTSHSMIFWCWLSPGSYRWHHPGMCSKASCTDAEHLHRTQAKLEMGFNSPQKIILERV